MVFRVERDALGERKIPKNVYYGIHTLRAKENFKISGKTLPLELFYAITEIKIACALASRKMKLLSAKKSNAIIRACKEVLMGKFDNEFVVDAFQAGAGTPTHMNVNEVIANRASEILKGKRGQYLVHPNDDVNLGQSTNNVVPSAIKIVALKKISKLLINLRGLEKELLRLSKKFKLTRKSGRTHLQDAVPITFGLEFHAYATSIKKNMEWIARESDNLEELNIGKNAIGTGVNVPKGFTKNILKNLKKLNKENWREVKDAVYGTQNHTVFLDISQSLKLLAVDLNKLSNDLRLLNSGPKTGLGEIKLPAVEPGSSIMPGKVNPSIAEMLNMVCFQVMANDEAVSFAVQSGQLDMNFMAPLIAKNLFESLDILINSVEVFTKKCIRGIVVNKKVCEYYYQHSAGLATLLNPYIGYDKATEIMKESLKTGKSVRKIVLEKKLMGRKELDKVFKN